MSVTAFMADLAKQGVEVWADGEQLCYQAPKGVMTTSLRSRLGEYKAEILSLLSHQQENDLYLPVATGEAQRHAPTVCVVPAPAQMYLPFPTTDVQQAYWIGRSTPFELGNVGSHCYIEVEAVELDLERALLALRRLIKRHPMLRAIMLPDGQQQVIEDVPPFCVEYIDLQRLNQQEQDEQLKYIRDEMDHKVFPVEQWPAWTIRVSRLHEQRIRIHVSIEVIFVDGWSLRILLQEFLHLYHEPEASLPPLELSFRDYVLAVAQLQASELYQRSQDYWAQRIHNLPPAPDLPLIIDPASLPRPRFVPRQARLDAAKWQQLKARAARAGLTPSGILLAAFAEVLTTWSKTPRFCINLTTFHRLPLHEQVDEIVGDFTSLLLLAIDNSLPGPFEKRAKRLQEQLWRDFDHRYYSGVRVLRDLARKPGNRTQAIMPVVFTSVLGQQTAMTSPAPWQETIYFVTQTPQVWLDHQVLEEAGNLVFYWHAVEALFPPGLLDAMFEAYTQLLERIATDDEVWQESSYELACYMGERLPRTGDLERYLPDGNSEFLEREDFLVKVQGHRIELGEVEQTLLLHPAVHAAVVTVITEPPGHKGLTSTATSLMAYVVLQSEQEAIGISSEASSVPTRQNHDETLRHLATRFGQTSIRKEIDKPVIDLACSTGKSDVLRRYRERLSYRKFLQEPIPFRQFSGFLDSLSQIELDGLPKYRYPSAGGIYPVQTYVSIKPQRIEGIPEGVYYYNSQSSQLVMFSDHVYLSSSIHETINQPIFDESAFSLFLIGDLTTISSIYGEAARDFCLLEAGYMSQLLMTTAAEYQVGLCPVGGLDFERIRDVFMLTENHLLLHTLLGGSVDPSRATGWSFLVGDTEKVVPLQPAVARQTQGTVPMTVTSTALHRFLAEKLPEYMLPSAIMILDHLPLKPDGKVDRKNLPMPEIQFSRKETGYRAPLSEVEQTIAAVWQEVLDHPKVGIHDNFYDLGGNSLLMVRAYTRLRKILDRDLSITEMFFEHPTVHALAEFLIQGQTGQPSLEEAREQ